MRSKGVLVTSINLQDNAKKYLHHLCVEIPGRRVGSVGNRAATDFFAERMASYGHRVECPPFDCIDWRQNGAQLTVGGNRFEVRVSPYSLGCRVAEPLAAVTSVEELESADIRDKVLLMHGAIAKEQIMPKNFPFYNPEHHRQILQLLETSQPRAIVAATTQDPGLAGAVSPFPLFEDGDFDIPSVYMTEEQGLRLAPLVGRQASLKIDAQRTPSWGCNVVTRIGKDHTRRIVLFAHIDAKDGTPGALDNGTGAVILLLLGGLLSGYNADLGIELVALNGEDYFAASGEKEYLALNEGKFDEILLGINLDGVGYDRGHTAYSLYDCPPKMEALIRRIFSAHSGLVEGERWYQSDHGLFLMNQRPALALTSERFAELWTEIAHTPKDTPEIVDFSKLIETARALRELLFSLGKHTDE